MSYNKGGRPLKYNNANDLNNRIQEYYDYSEEHNKVLSITGLCWFLGVDRTTLLNYETMMFEHEGYKNISDDMKLEFLNTIKDAKQRIEFEYEQALFNKNSAVGAIFTLKNNYKWVDKQEIEQSGETTVNTNTALSGLSKEELKELLRE
ncbi:MAG: terminase small subunit [Clostridium sp.]